MTSELCGIVLAAGFGTRMRSRGPKVLFPFLGKRLLDYPLQTLQGLGCRSQVVVIGAGADSVREHYSAAPWIWALQDPPRGTGDAALVALRALRDQRSS